MARYIRNYNYLGNVTIKKDISHVTSVKECDYRSVALASIRSFAVVRMVTTYVWINVLAGSMSATRLPTQFDYK